jgi:hypothetical protein
LFFGSDVCFDGQDLGRRTDGLEFRSDFLERVNSPCCDHDACCSCASPYFGSSLDELVEVEGAGDCLTAPIPPLAPVMIIIFPFWELEGFEGSIAGYGSRRLVGVGMNGVVN